MDAQV